jgi:hypothetical protein
MDPHRTAGNRESELRDIEAVLNPIATASSPVGAIRLALQYLSKVLLESFGPDNILGEAEAIEVDLRISVGVGVLIQLAHLQRLGLPRLSGRRRNEPQGQSHADENERLPYNGSCQRVADMHASKIFEIVESANF